MQLTKRRAWLAAAACAALAVPLLAAVEVVHLNLQDMAARADKVFRGTVLSITPDTVTAGGGEIPTVTYRLRVDEAFKGTFIQKDEYPIADVQMVGRLKEPPSTDTLRALPILPDLPKLQVGKEYVLLTTTPSPIGLSTTVGLGQGCFKVFSQNKTDLAVNKANNVGLFDNMNVDGVPSRGPIAYLQLAGLLRDLVADGE